MVAPAWTLDETSFLLSHSQVMSGWSGQCVDVDAKGNYYGLLGVSATADCKELNTAYLRLALSYHPDKIPLTDSDEVRHAKVVRFRALGEAKTVLLDPSLRKRYDNLCTASDASASDGGATPSMPLSEAYLVWTSAVLNAFKRCWAPGDVAVKIVAALGVPALMIAMGGAERGGHLCMTFALILTSGQLDAELRAMNEENMHVFRQAVMVLAQNTAA